jgi:hypothetical protein
MRLITGTVKSTELQWLPVLSNIAQPKLRLEAALFRELKNSWINRKSLLFEQLQDVPALVLRSRNPIWIDDPGPTNTPIHQGKCAFLVHRWGYATNCDCGHPCQTMNHIIDDCPIHAFEDGSAVFTYYMRLLQEAIQYFSDLNIDL